MDAPISFPHLFLCSLNEVHRSSSTTHALFHPVFIYRIFLFLGLDDFHTFEPIHIIAPIGATFLRQRVAQIRESSKCPRVEPSSTAPPPSSTGTTFGEASADLVGGVVAVVPPPFTSDDFDICRTLETIMLKRRLQRRMSKMRQICSQSTELIKHVHQNLITSHLN